jgi:hypothetical protein
MSPGLAAQPTTPSPVKAPGVAQVLIRRESQKRVCGNRARATSRVWTGRLELCQILERLAARDEPQAAPGGAAAQGGRSEAIGAATGGDRGSSYSASRADPDLLRVDRSGAGAREGRSDTAEQNRGHRVAARSIIRVRGRGPRPG